MQLQPPTHCKLSGFILNERCTVSSKMEVHRYVDVEFLWSAFLAVGVLEVQSNLLIYSKQDHLV